MPVTNNPIHVVYNRWERFLNDVSRSVGKDRELDGLSDKLAELKGDAMRDGAISSTELDQIHAKMEQVTRAYAKIAEDRGYPLDRTLPTTKKSFEIYGEDAQVHFQTIAGKEIKDGKIGGALGDLRSALAKTSGTTLPSDAQKAVKIIAMDLVTSATPEIAEGKIALLRGELSRLPDRATQKAALAAVRAELESVIGSLRQGGRALPIHLARFDAVASFTSGVAVHKVSLPSSVKGTNALFPNKPVPGWEQEVARATKAGFDDLSKAGKLFLDDDVRFPVGATKNVAVKLDMNLGREGTPSVSDPASTAATISELLTRSAAKGKHVTLTVGDSSGGENIPLGRTSMDIMKDTGNYHFALKAGLAFAAANGSTSAKTALAKVDAAEARGVYFGSKDDTVSTKNDLALAEAAAKPHVVCVDYDVAGFTPVVPDLGPEGLALWGTKEFHIAKPWVEADFRVHVARGLSTHTLAGWTGAQKGLIGLHGFGLRPADQSGDKRGTSAVDLFKLLGGSTGFLAMFSRRQGMPSLLEGLFKLPTGEGRNIVTRWEQLMSDGRAGSHFRKETEKLADALKVLEGQGVHQVEIFDRMRSGTREILEKCDEMTPGFSQHLWDTAHEATRFAMVNLAREPIRQVLPSDTRDEAIGSRIGVLTDLPYQSDLVVQSQAKIGVGGGPDAYREVRDVGHVAVGTNEMAIDAVAWELAQQPGQQWNENWPLLWATRLGQGPMHLDEITRLDKISP
jgi:hypothetical protein